MHINYGRVALVVPTECCCIPIEVYLEKDLCTSKAHLRFLCVQLFRAEVLISHIFTIVNHCPAFATIPKTNISCCTCLGACFAPHHTAHWQCRFASIRLQHNIVHEGAAAAFSL